MIALLLSLARAGDREAGGPLSITAAEREMREDLENFEKMVERGELGGSENQSPSR
ncbi:MAG: hypothetical protein H0V53_11175 [Rubrobacter sp.]|nr:hypothetical protein [Rubrobacter sp.]